MKILKSVTLWAAIISLLVCTNNHLGYDPVNIILIGLNPILGFIVDYEPYRHWLLNFDSSINVESSAIIDVNFSAYAAHFATFVIIGFVIDLISKYLRQVRVT